MTTTSTSETRLYPSHCAFRRSITAYWARVTTHFPKGKIVDSGSALGTIIYIVAATCNQWEMIQLESTLDLLKAWVCVESSTKEIHFFQCILCIIIPSISFLERSIISISFLPWFFTDQEIIFRVFREFLSFENLSSVFRTEGYDLNFVKFHIFTSPILLSLSLSLKMDIVKHFPFRFFFFFSLLFYPPARRV